jgi:hypothetical protein
VALTGCGPGGATSSNSDSSATGSTASPALHLPLSPKGTVNPTGGGAYAVTLAATLKQPDSFAPAAVAFRSDGDLITADQHGNAYG